jgi:hypothetical protein
MTRMLSWSIAYAFIVLPGIVHGLWTARWQSPPALANAVARLQLVPQQIGDWVGQDEELDQRQIATAGIDGYVMRRYTNRQTGAVVSMLLVCGRPGPIAVHSPDVCFAGAGFELLAAPVKYAPLAQDGVALGEFWTTRFRKAGTTPVQLRIDWAWHAAEGWEVPHHPRLAFARYPLLYKLYVICELNQPQEGGEHEPSVVFLKNLIPALTPAVSESLSDAGD